MANKSWKALFVKILTHKRVKVFAVEKGMTIDEVINFLLDNVKSS